MSNYVWDGLLQPLSGSWNTPGNWLSTGGGVPGAGDTAVFGDFAGASYQVRIHPGHDYTIGALAMTTTGDTKWGAPHLDISGSSLTVSGNLYNPAAGANGGYINLWNGASLTVDGLGASSETVWFHTGTNTLNLGDVSATDPSAFSSMIMGFRGGDGINLTAIGYSTTYSYSYSYMTHQLTIMDGMTQIADLSVKLYAGQHLGADPFKLVDNSGHLEVVVVCFAAGTHLLTARGEVKVEDLKEGDLMVTFSGKGATLKPVTWIGRRQIDLAAHPRPDLANPIRIRRGAFADAVPHRDLLVSPDHAIYADGVLIPAKCLVNGVTIVQDSGFEDISYFHVELEDHDILLAEGLTAESYLDTGNRTTFENADLPMVLHPDFLPVVSDRQVAPMLLTGSDLGDRVAARAGQTVSAQAA